MPLISINLRDPGGLMSHMNSVTNHVGTSLKDQVHSDLVFVCRSGSINSHQAMLEPLSPLLSTMFQQHNCCNCSGSYCGRREAIQIHLPDIHAETMRCVLNVIYTGKAYLRKAQAEEIEALMKLLDVKLPGEFKNEECSSLENPATNVFDTPSSSLSSKKRKASGSPSKVHMLGNSSSLSKAPRIEATEKSHEKLLIEMVQKLMPFEENKILDCNVAGCAEGVTHHNMNSHFKQHFHERENKQPEPEKMEIIMFKCAWCPKEFKFRRALDQHKKNFHQFEDRSKKNKEKESVKDVTLPMKYATNEPKSNIFVCQYCKQETKSEWHLTPSRHRCPLLPMIEASKLAKVEVQSNITASSEGVICNQCGKTLESSWHMSPSRHNCKIKIKHEIFSEDDNENINCEQCGVSVKSRWHLTRHSCGEGKDGVGAPEISVYDCQVCISVFEDFSNLSSHYTREHYWTRLFEEFSSWANRCSICLIEYPTNEDLIYHMGNAHRKFNKYLKDDGYRTLQIKSKFKLEGLKCGIENCPKEADNPTKLRMHLCTSHFSKSLAREFTEGDFSPCYSACPQTFPNQAKRMYHIGCYHNEVLKYAAYHYTNAENQSTLSSLFDLTELRKGFTFQQESQKKEYFKSPNKKENKTHNVKNYKCGKCSKEYTRRTLLKTHIAFSHYKEKLMKTYSGTNCGICECVFESNKHLLKHVAFKHDSVIAYLLGKDGLTLPRKLPKNPQNLPLMASVVKKTDDHEDVEDEEDVDGEDSSGDPDSPVKIDHSISLKKKKLREVFQTLQCQICLKEYVTPSVLRLHYASSHYIAKLSNGGPLTQCPICSTAIDGSQPTEKGNFVHHLTLNHVEALIGCMKDDNLWVGESKIFSLGENGFNVKKLRIDIKMTEQLREKARIVKAKKLKREERKKKKMKEIFETKLIVSPEKSSVSPEKSTEPKLTLEELMTCFLCKKDFNHAGQNALLSHFSEEHYRLELEHNYITRPGMMWMTDKRCPTCFKIVETKEELVHHIGVEHRAVEKFLPEKYKLPTIVEKELSFPCPLKNCSSDKETKKALLVHLLIVHYQKDMEREFGPIFHKEGKKKCPKCNMALLDNYLGYMKHIAVEHAHVMNFVERDNNGTPIENNRPTNDPLPEEREKGVDNQRKGADLISVLDNDTKIQNKSSKVLKEPIVSSDIPVLNPFFSDEAKTKDEVQSPEVAEDVVPNLLQFEASVRSPPATASKENTVPTIVLVNETESRSHSPESSAGSIKKSKQVIKSFDLRAILDSDSD